MKFNETLVNATGKSSILNAITDPYMVHTIWSIQSDPLNYRGITITSATYKLFCSILNNRLTRALELNNVIADEQNGFRAGRSTGDHISSLSLIIESRIKRKKRYICNFY